MLEIHDELAAQIQNSTEVVEYIDGVSSIVEDDEEKSTLTSIIGAVHVFLSKPRMAIFRTKIAVSFFES